MSCAKAGRVSDRKPRLYRQHRPFYFPSLWHLLDGRLPYRGSRFKHATVLFLLNRRRAIRKQRELVLAESGSQRHLAVCGALFLSLSTVLAAPAIDGSRLPPPAANTIDLTRDIKPIIKAS